MMTKACKNFCTLIVSFLLVVCCCGQKEVTLLETLDSKGREFIVGFLKKQRGGESGSLTLSLASSKPTHAVVSYEGKVRAEKNMKPGKVETISIPARLRMNGGLENKGILITADEEISVYGLNQAKYSTDAYLALPTDSVGSNYYIASYGRGQKGLDARSLFAVIGIEDKTEVNVTASDSIEMPGGSVLKPGQTTRFTINQLESYTFQSQREGDLTGTWVTSNKPITVLSGHECANVPATHCCCDHLEEQLPPVKRWGKEYVTAPFERRKEGDIFRIISSEDGTVIKINNVEVGVKNAGEYLEQSLPSESYNHVTSTKPVLLVQYCKSTDADGIKSDPFMIIVPPVGQYASAYTISTPSDDKVNFENYMSVIMGTNDTAGLRLDDRPLMEGVQWHPVTAASSRSLSVAAIPLETGSHSVRHISPIVQFAVIIYGYASFDSYGYPGGLRLADLLVCSPTPDTQGDGKDNDCDGRIDEELRNYKDDDEDGVIDEDLATPTLAISAPPSSNADNCSVLTNTDVLGRPEIVQVVDICRPVGERYTDRWEHRGCVKHISRLWLGQDACGNLDNGTQVITVSDRQGPSLVAPPNARTTCDSLNNVNVVGSAESVDACDGNEVVLTFTDEMVGCVVMRTWQSKDSCGNAAESVTQNISLVVKPPDVEVPQNLELRCNESTDPSETGYLKVGSSVATDCGILKDNSVNVSYSDEVDSNHDCGKIITRIWTVTYACGRRDYRQTISVIKDRTPIIRFPADVSVPCSHLQDIKVTGEPQAFGNCSPVQITNTDILTPCGIKRNWTVRRHCGQSVSAPAQIITLQYDLVLNLPSNKTIKCTAPIPTIPNFGEAQVACGDLVVRGGVEEAVETVTGDSCKRHVNRRLVLKNTCGEFAHHDYTITVVDKNHPRLKSSPSDTTATCAEALNFTLTGEPVVTDSCNNAHGLPRDRLRGTTLTRRWTLVDSCGNRGGRFTQTIEIVEPPPVITVTPNITLFCRDSIHPDDIGYPILRDIHDDCFHLGVTTNGDHGDEENGHHHIIRKTNLVYRDETDNGECPRTVTRTWTATTFLGHTVTSVQLIIQNRACTPNEGFPGDGIDNDCDGKTDEEMRNFKDDDDDGRVDEDLAYKPPILHVVPSKIIKGCWITPDPASKVTVTLDPNCTVATTVYEDVGQKSGCPRQFERLWNVTDDCGNIAALTQVIRIVQDDPPTLVAPSNTFATCRDYLDTRVTGKASVKGGCEGTSNLTAEFVDAFKNCTVFRTWTVSDSCGNAAPSVVQEIEVHLDAPSVEGPSDIGWTCPGLLDPEFTGRPVITKRSLCGTDHFVSIGDTNYTDITVEESKCRTRITRTWRISDVCDNLTVSTQTITVARPIAPVVVFPGNTKAVCSDIMKPNVTGSPVVTDNCTEVLVTHRDRVHDCYVEREWRVQSKCRQDHLNHTQIIDLDYEPFPVVPFSNLSLSCDWQDIIPVYQLPPHKLECNGLIVTGLTVNHSDIERTGDQCLLVVHRQAVVSDSCGNVRIFHYWVTFRDNTAPSLVVPPDQNVSCAQALQMAETEAAAASDLCNTVTVTYKDQIEGNVLVRTWQAEDRCGNPSPPKIQRIVLKEDSVLVGFPMDVLIPCNSSILPESSGFPRLLRNVSRECYALGVEKPLMSYTDRVNGSGCPREIVRTWKVSTVFGHVIEKSQRIEIEPPPCEVSRMTPADRVDNDCDKRVDEEVRDYKDNDGDGLVDEDLFAEIMEVSYPADLNVTSCSVSLEPAQSGTVKVVGVANECQPATVTHTDALNASRCWKEIVRQWLVVDACGNIDRGTQILTVYDLTAPVIVAPSDLRVPCIDLNDTSITGRPQISDDCQQSNVSYWFEDTANGCYIERHWFAKDDCGSSSETLQIITPLLQANPVQIPDNMTLPCGESLDPIVTGKPVTESRKLCNYYALPVTLSYDDSQLVVDQCMTVMTRNWVVGDDCGNFSNFQQKINIKTQSLPSVTFPPSNVSVTCNDLQDIHVTSKPSIATQGCLQVNFSYNDSPESCQLRRTWVVHDQCGRLIDSHNQTVRLQRSNKISVAANATASCRETVNTPLPVIDEQETECGLIAVPVQNITIVDETVLDDPCNHQVTRRIYVTGNCARDEYYEQTITYEDREPPVAELPHNITNASCAVAFNETLAGRPQVDDCNKVSLNYSDKLVGTTLSRTWMAVDACANRAHPRVQRITLMEEAPLVIYPNNLRQGCGSSVHPNSTGWPEIIRDIDLACFLLGANYTTVSYRDSVTGNECPRTIRRTWLVETYFGHQLKHIQTITIDPPPCTITSGQPRDGVDNDCDNRIDEEASNKRDDDGDGRIDEDLGSLPLQFSISEGSTATTCRSLYDPNTIGKPSYRVDDKCQPVQLYHEDHVSKNSTLCHRMISRKWNGSDACGNVDSLDQFIEFTDGTAPEVRAVSVMKMSCSDMGSGAMNGITFTDDCGEESVDISCSHTFLSNYTLDTFYGCVAMRQCFAQDSCGNRAPSFNQTVGLDVNSLPAFSVKFPDNAVVTCGASTDLVTAGRPVSNDYAVCDSSTLAVAEVKYFDTILSSSRCVDILQRQWHVKDVCGQGTKIEMQNISVIHNPSASIIFPASTTVACDDDIGPDKIGWPNVTMNCSDVELSYSDTVSECVVLRTWNATDICGNVIATAVQRIAVSHLYNHTFADTLYLSCEEQLPEPHPSVYDKNCHGIVIRGPYISYKVDDVSGGVCQGMVRRNITVASTCGALSWQRQTVEVKDREQPSVQYPPDINVTCNVALNVNVTGQSVANDSCTLVNVSFVDRLDGDTILRTWSAVDHCGNKANAHVQRIGLLEEGDELLFNPIQDLNVYCNESTSPDYTGRPELAQDVGLACQNLGIHAATITYEDYVEGTCPRTIRRKWIAVSSLSRHEIIQVIKQVPRPLRIVAPDDVLLPSCKSKTDPLHTGFAIVVFVSNFCLPATAPYHNTTVTSTSRCTTVLSRHWMANDSCGNVASAVQVIEIEDKISPTIVVPRNVTASCHDYENETYVGVPSASDDCSGVVTTWYSDVLKDCIVERSWLGRDECGNVGPGGVQTIRLLPEPPDFRLPGNVNTSCRNSIDPMATGRPRVGESRLCSWNTTAVTSVVHVDSSKEEPNCNIVTRRQWTLTDVCGFSIITDVQTIILRYEPVVIEAPADLSVSCREAGNLSVTGKANVTSSCRNAVVSHSDTLNESVVLRFWNAEDGCSRITHTVPQRITLQELPPVLRVPLNVTIQCHWSSHPNKTGWALLEKDLDFHCFEFGGAATSISYTDRVVQEGCPGIVSRQWIATSFLGHVVSVNQTITLGCTPSLTVPADDKDNDCDARVDEEARNYVDDDGDGLTDEDLATLPVEVEYPPSVKLMSLAAPSHPNYVGWAVVVNASAGCEPVTLTFFDQTVDDVCRREIRRQWVTKDACGNVDNSSQTIELVDGTPPILFLPNDMRVPCSGYDSLPLATTWDDSREPLEEVSYSDDLMGCVVSRKWLARDKCGNEVSRIQNITLSIDPPIVTFPANITVTCLDEVSPSKIGQPSVVSALLCGSEISANFTVSYHDELQEFSNCDQITFRRWTVTDVCGNSVSSLQTIYIEHRKPVLRSFPDFTSTCRGVRSYTPDIETLQSYCGPVTVTHSSKLKGSSVIRRWQATDRCGLRADPKTQIIQLYERPPTLRAAKDVVIKCHESSHPNATGWAVVDRHLDAACFELGGTEATVTYEDRVLVPGCPGVLVRLWQAETFLGHEVFEKQIITLDCKISVAVPLDGTDNDCDARVDEEVRNFIDDDGDGRIDEDLSTFPVALQSLPSVSLFSCRDPTEPEDTGYPEILYVSNSCHNVNLTHKDNRSGGLCQKVIVREWTATDSCGNIDHTTQRINVTDDTVPSLSTPQNRTVTCSEYGNDAGTGIAHSVDDCTGSVTMWYEDDLQGCVVWRRWKARDECNNTASSVVQTLHFQVDAPRVKFPDNRTVTCLNSSEPAVTGLPIVTEPDMCGWKTDGAVTVNYTDEETETEVCHKFVSRLWRVSHVCGHELERVQSVRVLHLPPVVVAPSDVTSSCSQAGNLDLHGRATVAQSCKPVNISYSDRLDGRILQRKWIGIDSCGRSSLARIQTIALEEEMPQLSVPPNLTITCQESVHPNSTGWAVLAKDLREECFSLGGGPTAIEYADEGNREICPSVIVRRWKATSFLGHTISANQAITRICRPTPTVPADGVNNDCDALVDEEVRNYFDDDNDGLVDEDLGTWPIVIRAPESVRIPSGTKSTHPSSLGLAVVANVSDACKEAVAIDHVDVVEQAVCQRRTVREWRGRDSCGNVHTVSQMIIVEDETPPVLSIPPDTVSNCSELHDLTKMGSAKGVDNFGGNVETWYIDHLKDCAVLRHWHGKDQCNNQATVEIQTIRLRVVAPSVTAPSDVEISCLNGTDLSASGDIKVTTFAPCKWNTTANVTITRSEKVRNTSDCHQITERHWTVSDGCGNVERAVQTVVVRHDVAVLDIPADITSSCNDAFHQEVVGFATVKQSCRETQIRYEDTLDGPLLLRRWTASDVCNRQTVAQVQTITLQVPRLLLIAPPNSSVLCHESVHPNVTGWAVLEQQVDDSCLKLGGNDTTIDYTDKRNGKDCFGSIVRHWKATDFLGRTTQAEQVIAIGCDLSETLPADGKDNDCDAQIDEEARNFADDDGDGLIDEDLATIPIQIESPNSLSLTSCQDSTQPSHMGQPNVLFVSENCKPNRITYNDYVTTGPCGRNITREWVAEDACGNTDTAIQVIDVKDRTPPTLLLPRTRSVTCEQYLSSMSPREVRSHDDCGSNLTTWFEDELRGCVVQRTWHSRDKCGNVGGSQIQILSLRVGPPKVRFPVNISVSCFSSLESTVTGNTVVTGPDMCGWNVSGNDVVTVDHIDGKTELEHCDRLITRTWRVSDVCGNELNGVQQIIVVHQPPIIEAPLNATSTCDGLGNTKLLGQATTTQSCQSVKFSYEDTLDGTVVIRRWTGVDSCGRSSLPRIQVIALEEDPPRLSVPPNVTLPCHASTHPDSTGWAVLEKDVSESCFRIGEESRPTVVNYTDKMDNYSCPGFIVRQWKATSFLRHDIHATQTITLSCQVSVTVPADGKDNDCDAVVDEEMRNFIDDDGDGRIDEDLATIPVAILSPPSVSLSSCRDPTNPRHTGLPEVSNVSKFCRDVNLTHKDNLAIGSCQRVIVREWRAVDSCGNADRTKQVITIRDRTPPFLSIPNNRTVTCSEYENTTVTGIARSRDDCPGNVAIWYEEELHGCAVRRAWEARDACNNSASTAVQTLHLRVNAPLVDFPSDATVTCLNTSEPEATGMPIVSEPDMCGWNASDVLTVNHRDDQTEAEGCHKLISRLWHVSHACGHELERVQNIRLLHLPPVIEAPPDVTSSCSETGNLELHGRAAVTQSCKPVNISYTDRLAGDVVQRQWIGVDACDRSSPQIQTIALEEEPPELTVPPNVTILCHESAHPNTTGWATVSRDLDQACFHLGGHRTVVEYLDKRIGADCPSLLVRQWIATSFLGHTVSSSQVIALDCSLSPTVPADGLDNDCDATVDEEIRNHIDDDGDGRVDEDLKTWPVELNIPKNVSLNSCAESVEPNHTGKAVVLNVSDACGQASIYHVDHEERTVCRRQIRREWIGRDECGNIAIASQMIAVEDAASPILSIPRNTVANCTELNQQANTGLAIGEDDCGGDVETWYTDELSGCEVSRHWHGRDQCGNEAAAKIQTIRLRVAAPSVTFPSDVEISCLNGTDPSHNGHPKVISTALCGWKATTVVTVTMTDKLSNDSGCVQSIERRWTVSDSCGNVESSVQNLVVRHDVALLDVPLDVTSSCSDANDLDVVGSAVVRQSCRQTDVGYKDTLNGSMLLRTWKARDVCGKETVPRLQSITLREEHPVLVVPSNTSILCHESAHPNITGWAAVERQVNANCTQFGARATTIDYTDRRTEGHCPGFVLRRWKATDFLGQTTHADQVITLGCDPSESIPADNRDNDCDARVDEEVRNFIDDDGDGLIDEDLATAPVEIAPPPSAYLISCRDPTSPNHTGHPIVLAVSESCKPTRITHQDEVAIDVCGFDIIREWIATDSCGNVHTAVQTISVKDGTLPSLTPPPNITRTMTCREFRNMKTVGTAQSHDDCDSNPTTWFEDSLNGCVVWRTWHSRDECGNVASSEAQILRLSVEPPEVRFPEDISVGCLSTVESTVTGEPVVVGPSVCGWNASEVVSFAYTDREIELEHCNMLVARLWHVADVCSKEQQQYMQHITIIHQSPVIMAPLPRESSCDDLNSIDLLGRANVSQCCKSVNMTYTDTLRGRVVSRRWVGVDSCGRASFPKIQKITLEEKAPVLRVPANVTTPCHKTHPNSTGWATLTKDLSPSCVYIAGHRRLTTIDYTDKMDDSGCPGFIVRQWRATSFLGHRISGRQFITLECTPSLTAPADGEDNDCDARVDEEARNYIDDDGDGLIDEDLSTFPVEVESPPSVTLMSLAASTSPNSTGWAAVTNVSRGCDPVKLSFADRVILVDTCERELRREWRAVDACDNVESASQVITLIDQASPSLFVPGDTSVSCSHYDSLEVATAWDDSNETVSPTYSDSLSGCLVSRKWEARDACGNEAKSRIQLIALKIDPPKVKFPPNITVTCLDKTSPSETGEPFVVPSSLCGWKISANFTVAYDDEGQGKRNCDRVIHRRWKIEDMCGNSVTALQTIYIVHQDPVLRSFPDFTTSCRGVKMTYPGEQLISFCGATKVAHSSKLKGSSVVRKWTAVDRCGRRAVAKMQTLKLYEDPPTVRVPQDVSIKCNDSSHPDVTGWATIDRDLDPVCFQLGGAATEITYEDQINVLGCPGRLLRRWKARTFLGHEVIVEQTVEFIP